MKKDKHKITFKECLFEVLAEIILTLIFFGVGMLVISFFDVKADSPNLDGDLITLIGIVIIAVIVAAVCALVSLLKRMFGKHK